MFARANEPQPIGGVLDTGFRLVKAGLGSVAPIAYLGSLLGAIWGWILGNVAGFGPEGPTNMQTFIIAAVLGTIVYALLSSLFTAAAIIRIRNIYQGQADTFGSAMAGGLRRMFPVFVASIMYGLAMVVGTIALVVPGIFLSVALAFCFYAAAADNKGAFESLGYSYEIVQGNWWRSAAVFGVIVAIALVFYFAIGFVSALFVITERTGGFEEPSLLIDVVIVPVLQAVITTLMYCLGFAVYEDLKLRREGGDLASRIEDLDKA